MLVLAAFLVSYLRRIIMLPGRREGQESSHSRFGAGFASLFTCLAVASQVDFPLRIYANGAFFAVSLALTGYLIKPVATRETPRRQGGLVKWLPLGFILMALVFSGRQLEAETNFLKAQLLDKDFQWSQALVKYREAIRLIPFDARYYEGLGNLSYRKASLAFRKEDKTKFRAEALKAYEKASKLLPYRANVHRLLGLLFEEEGNIERAKTHLKEAARLEPRNGLFLIEYGNFAYRQSMAKEALIAFEKLLRLTYWGETPETLCSIVRKCYALSHNYQRTLAMTPDDGRGHQCLGDALREAGKLDLAKLEYERAIQHASRISKENAQLLRDYLMRQLAPQNPPVSENSSPNEHSSAPSSNL